MNKKAPQFEEANIAIKYGKEMEEKPGIVHEYCPGLAVTMSVFGLFTVTHIPSGLAMCGDYERNGAAASIMVRYQLIAKEHGFSWTNWEPDTTKPLFDLEVPFDGGTVTSSDGTRKQTIKEWIQSVKRHPFMDEFPWEEKHPLDMAFDELERLAPDGHECEHKGVSSQNVKSPVMSGLDRTTSGAIGQP